MALQRRSALQDVPAHRVARGVAPRATRRSAVARCRSKGRRVSRTARLSGPSAAALLAACAALGLQSPPALAEQKPLWEAGLGIGAISFPDYLGSRNQTNYVVPVPYFVYRGRILRADKNGVQARLFDTARANTDLSLGASPPVRSNSDSERSGMPNLQATVAFGPAMEVHLWASETRRMRLDFRLPVRAVFTVERQPRQVGWQATPVLNLDIADPPGLPGWNLGLQAGPIFADRRYNRTYYGVDPQYATAERPAYTAGGGYAGSQFTVALSRRFRGFWVGAFARMDDLHGAVFADSPLVRRDTNVSAGFGIAWILGQSAQMVDSHE